VAIDQCPSKRFALTAWGITALVFGLFYGLYWAGYRLNTSSSMPQGIYRLLQEPTVLMRGMTVTLCPPGTSIFKQAYDRHYFSSGTCPSGFEPLLKTVAATEGDWVQVTLQGIEVNHRWLKNSAQLQTDTQGRRMDRVPVGKYRVQTGEIWLISSHHPQSFDSRYFGAVPLNLVQGIARPIWIWHL
jgi:conjugative transfer signal peptidase TraF